MFSLTSDWSIQANTKTENVPECADDVVAVVVGSVCCCLDWEVFSGKGDEGVELPDLELRLCVVVGVESDGTDAENSRGDQLGFKLVGAVNNGNRKKQ